MILKSFEELAKHVPMHRPPAAESEPPERSKPKPDRRIDPAWARRMKASRPVSAPRYIA